MAGKEKTPIYDTKLTFSNMPSADGLFRNARLRGRRLDMPFVHEIVRPAKVADYDYTNKTVTLEWLDNPGTQFTVLLSFPIVGRDWGVYSMPHINDMCSCAIEGGRVRILSWVPRNVSLLRYVQPGEVMVESSMHAGVYARNFPFNSMENGSQFTDGVIHIFSSPQGKPNAQVIVGKVAHHTQIEGDDSGDKYLYQVSTSAGNEFTYDEKGNHLCCTTGSKTEIVANDWTDISNNRTIIVKKKYQLIAHDDYGMNMKQGGSLTSEKAYSLKSEKTLTMDAKKDMNLSSNGPLSIKSQTAIRLEAPMVLINSITVGGAAVGGIAESALSSLLGGKLLFEMPGLSSLGAIPGLSNIPGVGDLVTGVVAGLGGAGNVVSNAIGGVASGVMSAGQSALGGAAGSLGGAAGAALGGSLGSSVSGMVGNAVGSATGALMGSVSGIVGGAVGQLGAGLNNIMGSVVGTAGRLGSGFTKSLGGGDISSLAGNLVNNYAKNVLSGGMNKARGQIGKSVNKAVAPVMTGINSATSRVNTSSVASVSKYL